MSQLALRQMSPSPFEQLRLGREILRAESQAVERLASRLDVDFCSAVTMLAECRGSVVVSGMGKAGIIGRKISATLCSTGTSSIFLHPAEALHGDLGRVRSDDCALILSQSGETEEVLRLLPALQRAGVPIMALTARRTSRLAKAAQLVLDLGTLHEACPLGLAPSTSTTVMLALGDALALVVSQMRGFSRADFAAVHPAGSLGQRLSKVDDWMRPQAESRIAPESLSVREVFLQLQRPGRRTGAIILTDANGRLTGIFTDSDLARLFEGRQDGLLDQPISRVMTARPLTVQTGSPLADAVTILAQRKISELPIVDSQGYPLGMLDVTDLVGMIPELSDY